MKHLFALASFFILTSTQAANYTAEDKAELEGIVGFYTRTCVAIEDGQKTQFSERRELTILSADEFGLTFGDYDKRYQSSIVYSDVNAGLKSIPRSRDVFPSERTESKSEFKNSVLKTFHKSIGILPFSTKTETHEMKINADGTLSLKSKLKFGAKLTCSYVRI